MYSISIFYFTFYLFGGCVRTQRTPRLWACACTYFGAAGTRLGATETVRRAVGACAALVALLLTDIVRLARAAGRIRRIDDVRRISIVVLGLLRRFVIAWLVGLVFRLIGGVVDGRGTVVGFFGWLIGIIGRLVV